MVKIDWKELSTRFFFWCAIFFGFYCAGILQGDTLSCVALFIVGLLSLAFYTKHIEDCCYKKIAEEERKRLNI
jgi:hypothetical protein